MSDVCKVWNVEASKYILDTEDSEVTDAENETPNYLLAVTQVLYFYLTHLTEKYSASDMNIEEMLHKIGGKFFLPLVLVF